MDTKQSKGIDLKRSWLWMLIATYFVLLWGTFVRVSRSGSGCGTSWPKCEGSFLFDINNSAQIIEYVHRLTSGVYGLLALALVIYIFFKKSKSKWVALSFLFFLFWEAMIGRILVVQELVVDDARIKRLVWMGLHFLNTLILITHVIGLWKSKKMYDLKIFKVFLKRLFTHPLVLGFLVLSLLGIVTAFFDTSIIRGQHDPSVVPGWVQVMRNIHPFMALAYVVYAFVWGFDMAANRKPIKHLLAILVLNMFLGLLNILFYHLPYLQVMHVLGGHMIWLCLNLLVISDVDTA